MPYTLTLTHICKERKTAKKALERVGFSSDLLVAAGEDFEEEKKEYPTPPPPPPPPLPPPLLSSSPLLPPLPNKSFSMCSFVSAFNRSYTSLKIVLAGYKISGDANWTSNSGNALRACLNLLTEFGSHKRPFVSQLPLFEAPFALVNSFAYLDGFFSASSKNASDKTRTVVFVPTMLANLPVVGAASSRITASCSSTTSANPSTFSK